MTSKFLTSSTLNVSDGSEIIFGSTLGATNIKANTAIKSNSSGVLYSSNLEIADVNLLQGELDAGLSNPATANLDMNVNRIVNMAQPIAPGDSVNLLYFNNTAGDFKADGSVPMTNTLNMGDQILSGSSTLGGDLTLTSNLTATKGQIVCLDEVSHIDGTAALPSVTFTSDLTSGLSLSGTSDLVLSRAGGAKMTIGGNIEAGTTLDMKSNNITNCNQIGATAPGPLEIFGNPSLHLYGSSSPGAGEISLKTSCTSVYSIQSSLAPSGSNHLTNKTYVDGLDALNLKLTGGILTGDLDIDSTNPTLEFTDTNNTVWGNGQGSISFKGAVGGLSTFIGETGGGTNFLISSYNTTKGIDIRANGNTMTLAADGDVSLPSDLNLNSNNIIGASEIQAQGGSTLKLFGAPNLELYGSSSAGSGTVEMKTTCTSVYPIQTSLAPSVGNDLTNKTYVDGLDALNLKLTGGVISGNLTVDGDLLIGSDLKNPETLPARVKEGVDTDGVLIGYLEPQFSSSATYLNATITKTGRNYVGASGARRWAIGTEVITCGTTVDNYKLVVRINAGTTGQWVSFALRKGWVSGTDAAIGSDYIHWHVNLAVGAVLVANTLSSTSIIDNAASQTVSLGDYIEFRLTNNCSTFEYYYHGQSLVGAPALLYQQQGIVETDCRWQIGDGGGDASTFNFDTIKAGLHVAESAIIDKSLYVGDDFVYNMPMIEMYRDFTIATADTTTSATPNTAITLNLDTDMILTHNNNLSGSTAGVITYTATNRDRILPCGITLAYSCDKKCLLTIYAVSSDTTRYPGGQIISGGATLPAGTIPASVATEEYPSNSVGESDSIAFHFFWEASTNDNIRMYASSDTATTLIAVAQLNMFTLGMPGVV